MGHSISGGAATVAAATAPDLIRGLVEVAPFTRAQSFDVGGLFKNKLYRTGTLHLGRAAMLGNVKAWKRYLDVANPAKPADWDAELGRIEAKMSEPGRMKVLKAMGMTSPGDAGAQLANVRCPVLVLVGTEDPDWADPRAEGEKILADLPEGLGQLEMIQGGGHYLHTSSSQAVLDLSLPFLARTLARG